MILACPACRSRYLVDEQELSRPAGRTVRCASCGHVWRQPPPFVIRGDEPLTGAQPPRTEPALAVLPRRAPSPALPQRQRPRRRRLAAGWLILGAVIVLLALAMLAAIVDRGEVVARWPAAARLYAWLGIPPAVPR